MQKSRSGFAWGLLFAVFTIVVSAAAAAQDMPPILAPLTPAPMAAPVPPPASPSAEATISPSPAAAPAKPAEQPHIAAAAPHAAPTHHRAKFAALPKRAATSHHPRGNDRRMAARRPAPALPPGMMVPPPGYYGPGPYRHLVYAGPPPGFYGGWGGYRGPYPDYP
jgi:translation initiation factor IF-2